MTKNRKTRKDDFLYLFIFMAGMRNGSGKCKFFNEMRKCKFLKERKFFDGESQQDFVIYNEIG